MASGSEQGGEELGGGPGWAHTGSALLHPASQKPPGRGQPPLSSGPESHTVLASMVHTTLQMRKPKLGRHRSFQIWVTLKPTPPIQALIWEPAGLSSGSYGQSQQGLGHLPSTSLLLQPDKACSKSLPGPGLWGEPSSSSHPTSATPPSACTPEDSLGANSLTASSLRAASQPPRGIRS